MFLILSLTESKINFKSGNNFHHSGSCCVLQKRSCYSHYRFYCLPLIHHVSVTETLFTLLFCCLFSVFYLFTEYSNNLESLHTSEHRKGPTNTKKEKSFRQFTHDAAESKYILTHLLTDMYLDMLRLECNQYQWCKQQSHLVFRFWYCFAKHEIQWTCQFHLSHLAL